MPANVGSVAVETVGDLLDRPRQEVTRMPTAPARNEAAALLDVITRAANDPATDVDKVERLMALYERTRAHEAKLLFTEAKREMRPALPFITKKGHIIIRDKADANKILQDTPFARFEDIHEAVMPILTEHGFDLTFRNETAPDGKVRVTTVLDHAAGHSEETFFDLPHDSSGSKNAVQAIGSSTQYGKRYGMVSILNIRIAGEDDDGASAMPEACISKAQRDTLEADLDRANKDKRKFCEFMKVDGLADITLADFDKARGAVDAALKAAAKAGAK